MKTILIVEDDADELLAAIRQALPEPVELDASDHPTAA